MNNTMFFFQVRQCLYCLKKKNGIKSSLQFQSENYPGNFKRKNRNREKYLNFENNCKNYNFTGYRFFSIFLKIFRKLFENNSFETKDKTS